MAKRESQVTVSAIKVMVMARNIGLAPSRSGVAVVSVDHSTTFRHVNPEETGLIRKKQNLTVAKK